MPNANGHPASLTPAPLGNRRAERHGLYSSRPPELTEEDGELLEALMTLPHVVEADRMAAEALVITRRLFLRVTAQLDAYPLESARRKPRALLDHHRRLAKELREQLEGFGLTPASRASWVRDLSGGTLVDTLARIARGRE